MPLDWPTARVVSLVKEGDYRVALTLEEPQSSACLGTVLQAAWRKIWSIVEP